MSLASLEVEFEVSSSSAMATHATASTTTEEHLEYFVGISVEASAMSWVLDLFNVGTLVVTHLLLWITEHRVCLTYVLKHLIRVQTLFLFATGVLVRVPLECRALVSLLDLILGGVLAYLHDLVVVLPLRFLELQLRLFKLSTETRGGYIRELEKE
jgi:hypothetical protein